MHVSVVLLLEHIGLAFAEDYVFDMGDVPVSRQHAVSPDLLLVLAHVKDLRDTEFGVARVCVTIASKQNEFVESGFKGCSMVWQKILNLAIRIMIITPHLSELNVGQLMPLGILGRSCLLRYCKRSPVIE